MKHVPPPTGTPVAGPELTQDSPEARLATQAAEREEALQRLRGLRKEARAEIDRLLDFLDASDIDPDLEETADAEPSLGWSTAGQCGGIDDLEQQDGDDEPDVDDEPSLGWTTSGGMASAPPGFLDAELDESDMEDGADSEPSLGWGVDGETGNESGADRELAAQPSAASLETARKRHNHNSICNVTPIPGRGVDRLIFNETRRP